MKCPSNIFSSGENPKPKSCIQSHYLKWQKTANRPWIRWIHNERCVYENFIGPVLSNLKPKGDISEQSSHSISWENYALSKGWDGKKYMGIL